MRATETATFNITTPFGVIYSAWYDHYMAPGVFKVLQTELHGRFLERVGPGSHVLDVGCGGGQHAVHMASRRPDLHVTGVDLSPELVRRARRLAAKAGVADRVEFVEGDALNLAFGDQDFDHVYSAGSVKHWPDQRRGLKECLRVLRPGGRFLVMEADRSCRFSDVRSWTRDTRTPRLLRPALHAYFRMYIAGQSLDLDDARALCAPCRWTTWTARAGFRERRPSSCAAPSHSRTRYRFPIPARSSPGGQIERAPVGAPGLKP